MDKPSPEKTFKDGVYIYLAFSGKEFENDETADFVTVDNGKKTAYFLSRDTDEAVIEKATQNIDRYDEVYSVFGNEKKYLALRNRISKRLGVILYGDLYGLGYIFSTQRTPDKDNPNEKLKEMFLAGKSTKEMCEAFGQTRERIARRLIKMNVIQTRAELKNR